MEMNMTLCAPADVAKHNTPMEGRRNGKKKSVDFRVALFLSPPSPLKKTISVLERLSFSLSLSSISGNLILPIGRNEAGVVGGSLAFIPPLQHSARFPSGSTRIPTGIGFV